jgi:integrase
MGSIYKRKRKRPIPQNAEIVTKRGKAIAEWTGKDGRLHRAKLTEGGQKIEVESKTYYIQFFDEHGVKKNENTKANEIDTARQILQAREKRVAAIRGGIVDPAAQRLQDAIKQPIENHIDDYEAYLKNGNRSDYHIELTIRHIREAVDFLGLDRINDMTPERAMGFVGWLQNEPLEKRHRVHGYPNRSPRTINSYIVSIKSFYLWLVTTGRIGSNPTTNLQKLNETGDRRHERRAMTGEEFTKLLEAASNSSRTVQGIGGPTRATIYLTAALTGLRRKELASLTRADFRLDDLTPTVRIQGAYSKNKKTDEIPLHPALVDRLRVQFDRTAPEDGQPVFPLRSPGGHLRATAKMMRHDCKVAGISYSANDGFADFHANRVLFITSLCRSNVGLVTAQKLARHSDPKLTSNVYSKVSPQERAEAVGGISFETTGPLERHTRIENCSAIGSAPTANPDKMGQFLAAPKNPVVGDDQKEVLRNPLKRNILAQKKPVAGTTGISSSAGIRTPDTRIMIPLL